MKVTKLVFCIRHVIFTKDVNNSNHRTSFYTRSNHLQGAHEPFLTHEKTTFHLTKYLQLNQDYLQP